MSLDVTWIHHLIIMITNSINKGGGVVTLSKHHFTNMMHEKFVKLDVKFVAMRRHL